MNRTSPEPLPPRIPIPVPVRPNGVAALPPARVLRPVAPLLTRLALLALLAAPPALPLARAAGPGPAGFPGPDALRERAERLARDHPDLVRISSLPSGVPVLTVCPVPPAGAPPRPALLVLAGLEPDDHAGPLGVLVGAEALVEAARTNPATRLALDHASAMFLPFAFPPAPATQPAPAAERTALAFPPEDEDHDGLVDEDGPEDLDGDGRITQMRVQDPAGEYLPDPEDPRLLRKADRTRGEAGAWRLLTEGRDNDGDERWNEDAPGGLNPNRNFPAGFAHFSPHAGPHAVSDPGTRALADWVLQHPEIAVAFTFGDGDTLTQKPKSEPGGKRPATAVHEADLPWFTELGKAWRKALGLEKEVPAEPVPGSFPDWFYLHRGRLSLAARPWFAELGPALTEAPAAATNSPATPTGDAPAAPKSEPAAKPPAKPKADKNGDGDPRQEQERAGLKWLDAHAPGAFVPWRRFEHPDFPGRTVELGGFAPWTRTHAPESLATALARRQAAFLVDLVRRLPRIGLRRAEARALGDGVFEIRVTVENTGWLPTVLAHGEATGEVRPSRITVDLDDQAFLSGDRSETIGPLPGSGGSEEFRWVVLAPGQRTLGIQATSTLGGQARTNLTLPEASR